MDAVARHAAAGRKVDRTEVIEEHERPDVTAQPIRQQAPHDEAFAEIVKPGFDDERSLPGHAKVPFRFARMMPSRLRAHSVHMHTRQKRRPRCEPRPSEGFFRAIGHQAAVTSSALQAFLALDDLEADFLAFLQRTESGAADRAKMHEHVGPLSRLMKPKPLLSL